MNKNNCKIVEDLLPLYAEDMLAGESRQFVEEHLKECEDCRKKLDEFRKPVMVQDTAQESGAIKSIKKRITNERRAAIAIGVLLVIAVLLTVFNLVAKPSFLSYSEELCESARMENGSEILVFNDDVTGIITNTFLDEGKKAVEISAYSSLLDNMRGSETQIYKIPEDVHAVYYSSNRENKPSKLLAGNEISGEYYSMPRLALSYYFLIAFCGLGVLAFAAGVSWLVKKSIPKAIIYVLFAPLSYMIASLCIKGFNFVSYTMSWDFAMIGILTVVVYALTVVIYLKCSANKRVN